MGHWCGIKVLSKAIRVSGITVAALVVLGVGQTLAEAAVQAFPVLGVDRAREDVEGGGKN